jgi:hypothetical protein
VASDSEPKRDRWRARIKRFEERQRKAREWIKFGEIADWCSEEGSVLPDENKRAGAFDKLAHDLLDGEFEENGHSRVHFWHLDTATARRMTREWLNNAIYNNWDGHHGRLYLAHCWFPRLFFKRWLARHELPESPPRFEPINEPSLVRLKKQPKRRGTGAKAWAVAEARDQLWLGGIPPEGLTAKERDTTIINWMKSKGCSLPSRRTIQRVFEKRRT